MNKPRAPEGQYCPLWRKDVSKVCHTCDWYRVMPVQDDLTAPVRELWGCSIVLTAIAVRSMHASVDGVQAATESFHNDMAIANAQILSGAVDQRLINGRD